MKSIPHIPKTILLCAMVFLMITELRSQASFDSLGIKTPKHYFKTIIVAGSYRKPERKINDTADYQSRRLKTYGIRQFDFSFCTPLATFEEQRDSTTITNSHLLLTGNYSVLRPVFEGIPQHRLVKIGVGIRFIFNSGKKGIWFVDAAPFVTKDATYNSKRYFRLATTAIYSHNVNSWLNWRLGITKSFLWGNRFYWPFVGLRIGRLDKVNLSIQFPRCININMPLSSRLILSVYSRAQGGMYNFSNHDSLYAKSRDVTFNFTRYEINTGCRIDVRTGEKFNFFVALGLSSRNNITFYSESANSKRPRAPYRTYFYSQNMAQSPYLDLGVVFRLGKTRSSFNNKNLQDAFNLNSTMNGDGNAQLPIAPKKKSDYNLESIRDLVDYNDF